MFVWYFLQKQTKLQINNYNQVPQIIIIITIIIIIITTIIIFIIVVVIIFIIIYRSVISWFRSNASQFGDRFVGFTMQKTEGAKGKQSLLHFTQTTKKTAKQVTKLSLQLSS